MYRLIQFCMYLPSSACRLSTPRCRPFTYLNPVTGSIRVIACSQALRCATRPQEWSTIQLSSTSNFPDLSWDNAGPELSLGCCGPSQQTSSLAVVTPAPSESPTDFAKAVAQKKGTCGSVSRDEWERQRVNKMPQALDKLDRA